MLSNTFWLRVFAPIFLFTSSIYSASFAQQSSLPYGIPKGYYQFPVRPNLQNFLAGTMGELRPNHFHGGIDIKTSGISGLPVYAAAEGYISRIKISEGGYGNALYIQHNNGTTTVYGHLKKYQKKIADWVRKKQYEKESFAIELFPSPADFKVSKGELIAFSGNSGSSQGPHLHFEIRDKNQVPLNPLRLGFKEITDNIPPHFRAIALKTLDKNARINGQFGRFEYTAIKGKKVYRISQDIHASGLLGLQMRIHDKMNGTYNKTGVPFIEFRLNGELIYRQHLEKMGFHENRNILTHCDYETEINTRKRFNKLYVDDGNRLAIQKTNAIKGKILIEDGKKYLARVLLRDAYGNESQLLFSIIGDSKIKRAPKRAPKKKIKIDENILVICSDSARNQRTSEMIFAQNSTKLSPAYRIRDKHIYLWDLRKGLPESLKTGRQVFSTGFETMIPSGHTMTVYTPDVQIHFPKHSLFDTLYLQTSRLLRYDSLQVLRINKPTVPLRKSIELTFRPGYITNDKTSVYSLSSKGRLNYIGGSWNGRKISFQTKTLGDFTLVQDTAPPTVKPLLVSPARLKFRIKDNLSGIKSYRMEVNGRWVLMNYDYKRRLLWSEKLDEDRPFKGNIVLTVEDRQGNQQQYKSTL
ncbi:MAG: M23 family metallopeptidase [Cytophagales bacterium]|nr:M23 family metallopeptidase [Cytophagales bacterium]